VIAVLAAIALVATWPEAGHPDDTRVEVDAGTALAPPIEPAGPEEPAPRPVPPSATTPTAPTGVVLIAPPPIEPPPVEPPPTLLPSYETTAGPPLDHDEAYDAANALVSAIASRRIEIAAALAEAQRQGDARLTARLIQQREVLDTSLERAQSIVDEMNREHEGPPPASAATDLPVGP
jgi:hypothetical protein